MHPGGEWDGAGSADQPSRLPRRHTPLTLPPARPPDLPPPPSPGQATQWGTHSLAAAAQALVAAALEDPLNRWFVLLSEATVPLHSPQLTWRQLMHEQRSRVDACFHYVRAFLPFLPLACAVAEGAAGAAGGSWRQAALLGQDSCRPFTTLGLVPLTTRGPPWPPSPTPPAHPAPSLPPLVLCSSLR